MPERIQRRRTRGWRMPAGAIYVGRPTRWGNLASVERHPAVGWQVRYLLGGAVGPFPTKESAARIAVEIYREIVRIRLAPPRRGTTSVDWKVWEEYVGAIRSLRGRDLACWCPLDQPCHADVLLEFANQSACCDLHRDGGCCDPDDCGPCCPLCPTCPTLARGREVSR